jgi:hypothetical protein
MATTNYKISVSGVWELAGTAAQQGTLIGNRTQAALEVFVGAAPSASQAGHLIPFTEQDRNMPVPSEIGNSIYVKGTAGGIVVLT